MKKQIVIEYDIIAKTVAVTQNEFSTFESFGVIEAAKAMLAAYWLSNPDSDPNADPDEFESFH